MNSHSTPHIHVLFHPAAERVVCPFEELLEILNTDRIDSASNFAD